jgi:hypothetical protein
MAYRIKAASADVICRVSQTDMMKMQAVIEEAKEFAKAHLARMMEIKDLMKKFVENRDEYMVENTNYVSDQLSQYETHNLRGYKCGGYTYKNTQQ